MIRSYQFNSDAILRQFELGLPGPCDILEAGNGSESPIVSGEEGGGHKRESAFAAYFSFELPYF